MITLRLTLILILTVLAGCSPENRLITKRMEYDSHLRVTPISENTYGVVIQKNYDPMLPNVDDPDVRIRLVRTALNCPGATVLSDRMVDRGRVLGLPTRDYLMQVKC